MIKFRCPNCTQKIAVNDEGVDAAIDCPTCAVPIVVPPATTEEFRLPVVSLTAVSPRNQPGHRRSTPPDDAAWEDEAEYGATRAALLPHLARLMIHRLVRSLIFQRRHLANTQTVGTEQIVALESRLATLQDNYGARLKTYQVRVAALEQRLARLEELNRNLQRENFLLSHQLPAGPTAPPGETAASDSAISAREVGCLLRA